MQCDEIRKNLKKFVRHELSPALRSKITEHIATCPDCRNKLKTQLELNAVRDMNYLPDPGATYWRKLTRGVSYQAQPFKYNKKISKNLFQSASPKTRFAAVLLTAVLIYFLTKIPLFHKTKIDNSALRPSDINTEDIYLSEKTELKHSSYMDIFKDVLNEPNLLKKISKWENYIQTEPDEFSMQRARFEQAYIYYQIARSLKTKDHIHKALEFFEKHNTLFKKSNRYKIIQGYKLNLSKL